MGPTSGSGASPSRSWCCSGCGEVHDFEWEACWKCGGARGEGLAAQVPASAPAPSDEPVEKKTGILSGLDRHSFGSCGLFSPCVFWALSWCSLHTPSSNTIVSGTLSWGWSALPSVCWSPPCCLRSSVAWFAACRVSNPGWTSVEGSSAPSSSPITRSAGAQCVPVARRVANEVDSHGIDPGLVNLVFHPLVVRLRLAGQQKLPARRVDAQIDVANRDVQSVRDPAPRALWVIHTVHSPLSLTEGALGGPPWASSPAA